MKSVVTVLALAAVAFAAVPAFADNKCIDTRDIVSSKSDDGKILVFKMRDGTTLVNHLQGVCPDLKFNGYSWVLHGGDNMVCENEQSFHVIRSGEICVLGKFDAPVMAKRATN